jgi:phosphate transport system substrate-binding protein
MQALADAYTTRHPHVLFDIQPGNAEMAAGAVYARQADIAVVSRLPVTVQGREPPWIADLAMDGVAVIVNPTNPINNLTLQDLRDIYAGARNRWRDFGIEGLNDIEVAVREDGDGTRSLFDGVVMGHAKLTLTAIVLPSIEVAMNFVAYKPDAIAYVPSARITSTVSPVVKVISIEGHPPIREYISTERYPLARMLNLVALAEPQGDLREFVAWVLGREGQTIVAATNYVAVNPDQP